jgi:hypothetical protein
VREIEAELEFIAGEDGRAKEVVLLQGGEEMRAIRRPNSPR